MLDFFDTPTAPPKEDALSISNLTYSEPGSPFPDCREGVEPRTGRKRDAAITTVRPPHNTRVAPFFRGASMCFSEGPSTSSVVMAASLSSNRFWARKRRARLRVEAATRAFTPPVDIAPKSPKAGCLRATMHQKPTAP